MDTAGYVSLSRQVGLAQELQAVANNVANMSTAGYRGESLIFAEMVEALDAEGGSVALTAAHARVTSDRQGALQSTGARFDLALEGAGFFQVETPQGLRLTRAGSFSPDATGELVNPQGHRLLDAGGAPIFVPAAATDVRIASDGSVVVDGAPVAQIGRVTTEQPWQLIREDGVLFRVEGRVIPAEEASVMQGFLEAANVNPVTEISRMIEVQRAYEAGQRLLDREDERIRQVMQTVTQR